MLDDTDHPDDDQPDAPIIRPAVTPPPRRGLSGKLQKLLPLGEISFLFHQRLKDHVVVVQELLAVIGIAVGVALLFASQVASQSLDGSVRQLTKQLVGGTSYQLDARGSEGFPESVLIEAGRLPGVAAALPLLEQQATVIGPSGQVSVALIGADPRFASLGGPVLRKFKGRQLVKEKAIALPAPLAKAIGSSGFEDAKIQIGTTTTETLIAATLNESEVGALAASQVAIAPFQYAQELAGAQGRVSRVYIKTRPHEENLAYASLSKLAAIKNLNAVPADFDAQLFSVAADPAQKGESLFSWISALVGFIFAFNAMLLTVPERRRMIFGMRARGATRAMTTQTMVFDALILGAVACGLGLLLGDLISTSLFQSRPGYLAFAFPVGSQRVITTSAYLYAVGAGMLAALFGVLAPVRDILAKPLRSEEEREDAPRGWSGLRLGVGAACLATTTLIVIYKPQSAVLGVVTLVVAALALLPFLYRGIVLTFDWTQRSFHSTSTRLAVGELRDPLTRVRSLAVAATGATAVFGSVAVAGAQHNLETGLNHTATEWNSAADIWVSPAGVDNTLGTTPFSASIASKLTHVEGIKRVTIYRGSFLNIGDRRAWIIGPPAESANPIPAGQLTQGNVTVTNERLRAGGWAVVSEALAKELNLHIGETFTLPSPTPTRFRLAGMSTNGGWPPGAIVINSTDYARAWSSTAASALNIELKPNMEAAGVRLEIVHALGANSGLAVQTTAEREAQWLSVSHQGLVRLEQIAELVLFAAIVAMAGVMTSLIWQRRERLAYFKRTGNTKWLLWRALFFESAVLLSSGCLIGAVFGLYGQLVISHALATVTGFPITISVGAFVAIFSFAVVSGAALAIVAIPGAFAVRIRATMVEPA
jgi:putative ABC transport system permease protein